VVLEQLDKDLQEEMVIQVQIKEQEVEEEQVQ